MSITIIDIIHLNAIANEFPFPAMLNLYCGTKLQGLGHSAYLSTGKEVQKFALLRCRKVTEKGMNPTGLQKQQ